MKSEKSKGEGLNRREALALFAGVGALAAFGGTGCYAGAPTKPSRVWSAEPGSAFYLDNVKVVDVVKGEIIEGKAVLVEGETIRGLFDANAPELKNAKRLDGRGGWLIPGLINAHCHINSPSLFDVKASELGMVRDQIIKNYESAACWGVTSIRDMGAAPKLIAYDRERIDKGRQLGPRIYTAMSFIGVPNGYPNFIRDPGAVGRVFIGRPVLQIRNASEARDAVKRVRDQGANLVKIALDHKSILFNKQNLDVLTDEELHAVMDEAKKNSLPVACHHLYSQGLDRALRFGVSTLEHVVMDEIHTEEQFKKLMDSKIPSIPTATVGIALALPTPGDPYLEEPLLKEALQWKDDVLIKEMPEHATEEIYKKNLELKRFYETGEYTKEKNRKLMIFNPPEGTKGLVIAEKNLTRMIKEDAIIGVGNDSGVPFSFPGMIHLELETLVRLGMTRQKALRAATKVNADLIGAGDKCGTLEAGKWADMLLLEADPYQDIRNTGKIRAVFKGGVLVSKSEGFEPA